MLLLWLTVGVFITTVIVMPKRITWLEIYATAWFAITFASLTDIYLDLKLHFYGFFNPSETDWGVLILYIGMYPMYNAIFLNFYPTSGLWKKTLYIFGNVVFLACYEWFMLKTGVLFYNSWRLWYSVICYPLILLILYWNWAITKLLLARAEQQAN